MREAMQIFFEPMPVPSGVHVHHGRSVMFGSFVHFSAPPTVIAAIIKSKELVEMPNDPEKAVDLPGYSLQHTISMQSVRHPK
jgi:hypothetical protein